MRELKQKAKTFLLDVELVPKELIFIGRAMRILQANNQAMGKYVASSFGVESSPRSILCSRFTRQPTEHTGPTCILWSTDRHFKLIIPLVTDY